MQTYIFFGSLLFPPFNTEAFTVVQKLLASMAIEGRKREKEKKNPSPRKKIGDGREKGFFLDFVRIQIFWLCFRTCRRKKEEPAGE